MLEFLQPRFDALDGAQRILAEAHHDDPADRFALAVELTDTAPQLRAEANPGNIANQHRNALLRRLYRDIFEILQRIDVAGGADHVLGLRHLDHPTAGFHIAAPDGIAHPGQRYVVGAQLVRVHHHLILAHHAADGGDFRDALDGLQLVLQKPVLNGTQLAQVVLAGAVDQRVLIHPADPGSIGAKRSADTFGQCGRNLTEVFQNPRARPVQIGAVFKDDIDEGVVEKRVPAHGHGARHRQHGGSQRVSNLVLDHLRRLAGIAGLDDDLHVGQIRNRVQRRAQH